MPIKFNLNGNTRWLIAGAAAIVAAAAVTLSQVSDLQADQEKIDKRLDCVEANQKVLDRNQREAAADAAWVLVGVHALLDAADVDRTKRPDVKPSELEKPK